MYDTNILVHNTCKITFPDAKWMTRKYDLDENGVHDIKRQIPKSVDPSILKKAGKNPDIGYNEATGKVYIRSRINRGLTEETDLNWDEFFGN